MTTNSTDQMDITMTTTSASAIKSRSLRAIALDIRVEWGAKVNYAAKPYLDAMMQLNDINDRFYEDSAYSVVAYFLSNASAFRGDKAKALKAELKKIANIK